MALIGYARASTDDQSCEIQIKELEKAGCRKVFSENHTGNIRKRPQWELCSDYLREDDVLMVQRLDRLGRNSRDLQNIIYELKERGVGFKLSNNEIDTSSTMGKMFIGLLAIFAEFETNIRAERQALGIARAKDNGVYKGRKATAMGKSDEVVLLINEGKLSNTEIARQVGISESSFYRIVKKNTQVVQQKLIKSMER
ncbi:MAG: recombinase family protein [Pseudomonadota bacterium]